jgi:hypothetical protein
METINDQWKVFETRVLAPDAGALQRQEMKRAFFAGFSAALFTMTADISSLPDAEAEAALQSYLNQAKGFAETVGEGRA